MTYFSWDKDHINESFPWFLQFWIMHIKIVFETATMLQLFLEKPWLWMLKTKLPFLLSSPFYFQKWSILQSFLGNTMAGKHAKLMPEAGIPKPNLLGFRHKKDFANQKKQFIESTESILVFSMYFIKKRHQTKITFFFWVQFWSWYFWGLSFEVHNFSWHITVSTLKNCNALFIH